MSAKNSIILNIVLMVLLTLLVIPNIIESYDKSYMIVYIVSLITITIDIFYNYKLYKNPEYKLTKLDKLIKCSFYTVLYITYVAFFYYALDDIVSVISLTIAVLITTVYNYIKNKRVK